eukprot:5263509-Alexandrium_andersonii.AAC.1
MGCIVHDSARHGPPSGAEARTSPESAHRKCASATSQTMNDSDGRFDVLEPERGARERGGAPLVALDGLAWPRRSRGAPMCATEAPRARA